ncbi:MAG: EAL domain-containing protein [Sporolactobacillus sp.]
MSNGMANAGWLDLIGKQNVSMTVLEDRVRLQMQLCQFTKSDLQILKWVGGRIDKEQLNKIIEQLYEVVFNVARARYLLHSHKKDRIITFLKKALLQIFSGKMDDSFAEQCQKIARIFFAYKIRSSYHIAFYHYLEQKLSEFIFQKLDTTEQTIRVQESIDKIFSFQQQLTMEAFERIELQAERNKERVMRYKAYHDPLTGLPNTRTAEETINDAIQICEKSRSTFFILKLNIHRLKFLNQTFDRACGDFFLRSFAKRIQNVIATFFATLCRTTSDEFIIICRENFSKGQIIAFAQRLFQSSEAPYMINGKKIYGGFSLGIAVYPEDGITCRELQMNADAALLEAKKNGRNSYFFYSQKLKKLLRDKMTVENELQNALMNEQFILHYQPQIRAADQKLIGVEALIRWNHPERGLVAPGGFIRIAEENGLIREIGQWVLKESCVQMKAWQESGGIKVPVSVNLSVSQFHDKALLENIRKALDVSGLAPKYLDLEITESTMAEDIEKSQELLDEIRKMGISVSLDDFGTGYSSLSYLKNLPINRLKIDRSFVVDIDHNVRDQAIVTAIVSMAENLWIDVIAEGIETKDQLTAVANCRCRTIQGYYYSKPLEKKDFERNYL